MVEAATQDPAQQDDHPTPELVIEGRGEQLTLNVGGKSPTKSTLKLVGGKVEVEGEFSKGDVIVLRVEARVNELSFRDEEDSKTRQVIGAERSHRARIVGVQRID